jgi:hypothetical protein
MLGALVVRLSPLCVALIVSNVAMDPQKSQNVTYQSEPVLAATSGIIFSQLIGNVGNVEIKWGKGS